MTVDTSPDPVAIRPRKLDWKSAVTNGRRLHAVAPGDGAWARRFRDEFKQILREAAAVEGCTVDRLPEWKQQLARRCAGLIVACEQAEVKIASGNKKVDLKVFGMLADRLGRGFDRLGLKKQAKKQRDDAATSDKPSAYQLAISDVNK